MPHMVKILEGIKVDHMLAEIAEHDDLWNFYEMRTRMFQGSPHAWVDDIWLRYNDYSNFDQNNPMDFANEHESVWYAASHMLPSVKDCIEKIVTVCGIDELGGCLITRLKPGGMVLPHTDEGWHALHYKEKYLLCLKSNEDQKFCFDGEEHRGLPGDLFIFGNQAEHWVKNDSDEERISLIIAGRKNS